MREGDGQLNREDFVAEAGEVLEALAREIRIAETELARGAVPAPRVNALFRCVHSLKGLSGMLALDDLSRVAHRLEDYLDRLRMGRQAVDRRVLEVLLDAVDLLERLLDGRTAPAKSIDALLARLDGTGSAAPAPESGRLGEIDDRVLGALTQYEEHRLRACMDEAASILMISVRFPLDTFDDELRSLIGTLNERGEVISTLPSCASADDTGGIAFEILFASRDGAVDLGDCVGPDADVRDALPRAKPFARAPDGDDPDRDDAAREENDDEDSWATSRTGSVRVDLSRLDRIMNSVGELIVERRRLAAQALELRETENTRRAGEAMERVVLDLGKKLDDLQRSVIGARMVPVSQVVGRLDRLVRKLSRQTGKDIRFQAVGSRTELDKVMIDRLLSPLMHLVRNAVDHGLEGAEERRRQGKPVQGRLVLDATQSGNSVVLRLSDDGRGLDLERVRNVAVARGLLQEGDAHEAEILTDLLFRPGFSTAEKVSEVSGRGVGLDVVRREIAALNGSIRVISTAGAGATFEIELPITLAIIQSMLTRSSGQVFAIPVSAVSETVRVDPDRVGSVADTPVLRLRGATMPMVNLGTHFRLAGACGVPGYVVVLRSGRMSMALGVDELLGQQEVVIKAIGSRLEDIPGLAGATEIGQDEAALVLDPTSLAAEVYRSGGVA